MDSIDNLIRGGDKKRTEEKDITINRFLKEQQTELAARNERLNRTEAIKLLNVISEGADSKRRTKPVLGRTIKVGARYTPEEYEMLSYRIKSSGLPQGEYLRKMSLKGAVLCQQKSVLDKFILKDISDVRADIGRLAGLLIRMIKAYEKQDQSNVQVENWIAETDLVLQQLKAKVLKMEKDAYGDY